MDNETSDPPMSTSKARWIFLALNSLAVMANRVVYDQVSIFVARLTYSADACTHPDRPDYSCLDFNFVEFNGLYVGCLWAGAVGALSVGMIAPRLGILNMTGISAVLLVIGNLLFTIGPYATTTRIALGAMLCGRVLFGYAFFASMSLAQQMHCHWFHSPRNLAIATAVYFGASQLGSVINFATVGFILEKVYLQNTLWITFAVGVLGTIALVAASLIAKNYPVLSKAEVSYLISSTSRYGIFSQLLHLPTHFWLTCVIVSFFNSALFTLTADFPEFLLKNRDRPESMAALITGSIPDFAWTACLFLPFLFYLNKPLTISSAAIGLFFITLVLTAAIPKYFFPGLTTSLTGFCYAINSVSVSHAISRLVRPENTDLAISLIQASSGLGGGIFLLGMGFLLDLQSRSTTAIWTVFFAVLAVSVGAAWVCSWGSLYMEEEHNEDALRELRRKESALQIHGQAHGEEEHGPVHMTARSMSVLSGGAREKFGPLLYEL
ncbi:uncharacterized protein LOC129582650 [Paramacrobiotus metropolitanus]|uniref:uncharacterized protein LOC129582650 n=1 Tax=Paramacrobiotus metropolitanus TaxID=2943436 RepID=UPI002445D5FA|nr:uncharacterized protein LOC129582650 [Paramacrobiotus metropolitanus]